jgi:hypothetical protein
MRSVADEIGLDVEKESDLMGVAQYHLNESGWATRLLVNEFSECAELSENTAASESKAGAEAASVWPLSFGENLEKRGSSERALDASC